MYEASHVIRSAMSRIRIGPSCSMLNANPCGGVSSWRNRISNIESRAAAKSVIIRDHRSASSLSFPGCRTAMVEPYQTSTCNNG